MTTNTMMCIQDIAQGMKRCMENCDYITEYDTYFSDAVVNEESMPGSNNNLTTSGKAACIKKNEEWYAMMDVHTVKISEPLVTECYFVLKYDFDLTNRKTGHRMQLEELALYTVENGKITKEKFFHPAEDPANK